MADGKDRTRSASEDEDPFLARWSRRKQAAREPGPASPDAAADGDAEAGADDAAAPADAAATEPVHEPEVDESELPPPETLGAESDFSAYLSRRVSSSMRRAALRQLFSLPGFNVRDGLDDYDDDYTSFAPLGDTVTADMRYHEERLRARDEAAAAEQGEAPVADEPGAPEEPGGPVRTAAADDTDAQADAPAETPDDAEPDAPEEDPDGRA